MGVVGFRMGTLLVLDLGHFLRGFCLVCGGG